MAPLRMFFLFAALVTWAAQSFGQIAFVTSGANAGNNNTTVTLGATPAVGNLLIAQGGTNLTDRTITPSGTGWSSLRTDFTPVGCTVGVTCTSKHQVFFKFHAAGDPTSYVFSVSGGGSRKVSAGISVYSGVDATPFLAHGAVSSAAASATLTAPSLSPTSAPAGSMLVALFAVAGEATYTALPAGYVSRYAITLNGGGAGHPTFAAVTRALAATETPAAQNATASTAAFANLGIHLALRPATVAVTPGSFNAFETGTAAGAITGVIRTRIAGVAFGLDVVAISGGAQLAGFTDQVIVELLGNTVPGIALDLNNCPTSFTVLQTVTPNPTIAGGRSTVAFAAVANAWRDVRVRVRWPVSTPTATSCSTDNFAIRPNAFSNFGVTDGTWTSAGLTNTLDRTDFGTGSKLHKAGRPFSVRASAVNGAAAVTTNYADTPALALTQCAGAACTATFGTVSLAATFVAGQLSSDTATYSEVGSFNLELVDNAFSSVDNADGSTAAEREIRSGPINVGRFVPDQLTVVKNVPEFGTFCGTPGGFTYIGQRFNYRNPGVQPVISVTAERAGGGTTMLYTGNWWRITDASLTGKTYTAASGTFNTSEAPSPDPIIVSTSPGSGQGTLTFRSTTALPSSTGFFFQRTTPAGSPFSADVTLSINVIDADGVTAPSNPVQFPSIAFPGGSAFRFGRLRISNANGSQLVPLPVPVEAQYWNGTSFITNAADSCTSIAATNVTMLNYAPNLTESPCETALSGGGLLSGGRRTLILAAPGAGNNGSVDLRVTLNTPPVAGNFCSVQGAAPGAANNANLPYLQGNWAGGAFDQNPTARATFGVFKGADEVIFIRENF